MRKDEVVADFFKNSTNKVSSSEPVGLEKKSFDRGYKDGLRFVEMLRKV